MQDKFVKKKWQIKIERWAKNPEEKSKAGCTVGGGDADVCADELTDRRFHHILTRVHGQRLGVCKASTERF